MNAAPARRRPWASLSGRLTLGAVGGLLVAAIIFAGIAVSLIRSTATDQARNELDRQARAIAVLVSARVQSAFTTGEEFRPGPIGNLEILAGAETKLYYVGLNLSPGATAPTGGLPATVAHGLDPAVLVREGSQSFGFTPTGATVPTFAAATPVLVGSRYVGAVVLTRPQAKVTAAWGDVLVPILIATLLGLAVAVVLVLWTTRRATRPLRDLEAAAARVAGGDLHTEVVTGGAQELDAVARSFNAMVRQLARRDRLAREFLMRVTHDLRTPLTAIRGHALALADGLVPEEAIPRSLGAIESEATRLEVLVTDLLDLARMDAGRFTMHMVTVPAAGPLEQAGDALWLTAERRGVTLVVEISELPDIFTDPDRVQQVMTNLLDNAIRWTPEGGSVTLAARPSTDGGVIVEVADSGPGIAPEMRELVFEPFCSETTPDGSQGSGLGLAIARQLALALGGALDVGDAPGTGACFTLRLPAVAPIPTNDEGPPPDLDESPTPTAMDAPT